MQNPLDDIIPPEIRNDEFYELLKSVTAREPLLTVLEIGASSGEGSTAALVSGLKINAGRPRLFCLEASRQRFAQLEKRYAGEPFVHCFNASSVGLDGFPSEAQLSDFYLTKRTNLNHYPLELVKEWLRNDIGYISSNAIPINGIASIKSDFGIDCFDLVLIDGSEFTGAAELDQVIGAEWIALDDINAYKNNESYYRLMADPDYLLVAENWQLRNGYALFRRRQASLPVHFFTIVLNGMPFIRHHVDEFRHLPFRWHWHIVEGVAELMGDTAWSRPNGGHIPDAFHRQGLSIDGTTEYIDELQRRFPDNITIYRKPIGQFWQGKLEMVNAPLPNINEPCLLWEIDSDECWTHLQFCRARQMFIDEEYRTAAYYWCRFFVGPGLVVSSRNCYSQVSGKEWLRTWRYTPGCRWAAHEPPRLVCRDGEGLSDLAGIAPFSNDETEARGLVFQHFAYAIANQVRFKEKYYGYTQAVFNWLRLQKETAFPARLGDYLPWVSDNTMVDTVSSQGVIPLPLGSMSEWGGEFSCRTVIDAVFFQYHVTGIARVWTALLEELAGSRFAQGILIADRGGTAPKIPGYEYLELPLHDESNVAGERELLQSVCDRHRADLCISTWHTFPLTTPSLLMVHDMLPEILLGEQRLQHGRWCEKQAAIGHAAAYLAVSANTAKDLLKFYPDAAAKPLHVMHNGVSRRFGPAGATRIADFRSKFALSKPYYMFVGPRESYKNFRLLLEAHAMLPDAESYYILSTGGETLEAEFTAYSSANAVVLSGRLSEDELISAYSGAVALVYPSRYEGFGLPLLEAMACGCPVIASNAPAMVEVAGEAAMLSPCEDASSFAAAMLRMQDPQVRADYVSKGFARSTAFSWQHSASVLVKAVCGVVGGGMGMDTITMEKRKAG
ncbi:MAG: glycosyltransferase family 4 protein [Geobacteraceae bacterium]|nr:glycosyltransferase family 4 protein [Geobacteraceae bacterium]